MPRCNFNEPKNDFHYLLLGHKDLDLRLTMARIRFARPICHRHLSGGLYISDIYTFHGDHNYQMPDDSADDCGTRLSHGGFILLVLGAEQISR